MAFILHLYYVYLPVFFLESDEFMYLKGHMQGTLSAQMSALLFQTPADKQPSTAFSIGFTPKTKRRLPGILQQLGSSTKKDAKVRTRFHRRVHPSPGREGPSKEEDSSCEEQEEEAAAPQRRFDRNSSLRHPLPRHRSQRRSLSDTHIAGGGGDQLWCEHF